MPRAGGFGAIQLTPDGGRLTITPGASGGDLLPTEHPASVPVTSGETVA